MKFQHQDVIQIKNGASRALFAPQFGGRLLKWELEGKEIIFWPDDADWSNPRKIRGGNPLLFPFIARHVVDGESGWWMDAKGVKREMPVHGFAHSLSFTHELIEDGCGIRMALRDTDVTRRAYPHRFRFEAVYRLQGNSLQTTLITSNLGDQPMPYYPGHHFYFSVPRSMRDSATLFLPPAKRQTYLPDGALSQAEIGSTAYRLGDPRLQDHFHILENQQDIRLVTPALRREITLSLQASESIPWFAIGTWSDKPDADSYCVEPWLGLPNAIHNGQGLRSLAPGHQEKAVCIIDVNFF